MSSYDYFVKSTVNDWLFDDMVAFKILLLNVGSGLTSVPPPLKFINAVCLVY